MLIVGHLFLQQSVAEPIWQDDFTAETDDGGVDAYRTVRNHKRILAGRYIKNNAPNIAMLCSLIISGDRSSITDYAEIVGPVPEA